MPQSPHIFLAGASRGVGREIARCLRDRHLSVKAMLRSPVAQMELERLGCTVVIADALDAIAVESAMLTDSVNVVISTIGGKDEQGRRSDYLGNKHLIDAAVKAKVERFILVSSIGAGDSAQALPPEAMQALGEVLAEKEQAEQHLINSGLTYTIIRPGGLKSEPATGNGILTENPAVSGLIHRADVAMLVCDSLTAPQTCNRTLSAVDRQMVRGAGEFEVIAL
jgi:uncharacterized protein YbjT (DUF2867 family)